MVGPRRARRERRGPWAEMILAAVATAGIASLAWHAFGPEERREPERNIYGDPIDASSTPPPRIVFLTYGQGPFFSRVEEAFRSRLVELGIADNQVEHRDAGGDPRRIRDLVTGIRRIPELDVVVAVTGPISIAAAREVDGLLPVVFTWVRDPVELDLVPSWDNRAGSTVTGVSGECGAADVLELIRELLPEARRVGWIVGPQDPLTPPRPEEHATARGLELVRAEAATEDAIDGAMARLRAANVDVVAVLPGWASEAALQGGFPAVLHGAAEAGFPVIAGSVMNARRGALAAIGPDFQALGVAAAERTHAIVAEGRSPGELPVVRTECIAPVINQSVVERLGVAVPEPLAERATFVRSE